MTARLSCPLFPAVVLGVLAALAWVPSTNAGFQGSDVAGSSNFASNVPRFTGPDTLDLERITNGDTNSDDEEYGACIYGYVANEEVHKGVADDETGLTVAAPNLVDRVLSATSTAQTNLRFINSTLQGVVDDLRLNYIPSLENEVNNGTTQLKAEATGLRVLLDDMRFYNGTYMNYTCTVCSRLRTDAVEFEQQIIDQTDDLVADFQSALADIQGDLLGIASDIATQVGDLLETVLDIDTDALEYRADVIKYSKDANDYEDYRYLAFIVLFAVPLVTIVFTGIGYLCATSGKGSRHKCCFSCASYWVLFYAIWMWVIAAVHIVYGTVSADSCVYLDFYETGPLLQDANDCLSGARTANCDILENVVGCLNGSSLVAINNATEELDFSNINLPSIPDVNTTFSFSELESLDAFVDTLGPQDFGLPQCFLDALINDFNGYEDSALVPPRPSTSDSVKRALWIQERLGYELPFPAANILSTHNSYNRDNIRTHIELDTTVANQTARVAEDPTNQIFTINDQLSRLNIRFIEVDAHYLNPSAGSSGSGQGRHCLDVGATDDDKTRVCHASSSVATSVSDFCADPDNGWALCESVCVCDYGDHTACGIDPPRLSRVLDEINDWLDANPTDVVAIYIENKMSGQDAALNTLVAAAFGAKIHDPTPATDYTVTTNWATRQDMVNSGKQVVLFAVTSNGDTCQTTGPASATLSHFFCQSLRNTNRISIVDLDTSSSTCQDSTPLFFNYVTGTTIVNQVVLGSTDSSDDNTLGGTKTITEAKMADIQLCGHSPDMDLVNETLVEAALWSFASGFPTAFSGTSAGFFNTSLSNKWQNSDAIATARFCACRDGSDADRLTWSLSSSTATPATCPTACLALGGSFSFGCPRSNKEWNNLKSAYSSQSAGVWLNLAFDSSLNVTIEGTGPHSWPNVDTAQQTYGEQTHGSKFSEAQVAAANAASFAAPYSTTVLYAQQLIADKAVVLGRRTQLQNNISGIASTADGLLTTWIGVNDVMAEIINDTQPVIDAATNVVNVFDRCAGVDLSYFEIKDAYCNSVVTGTGGIVLASALIGLLAIFVIAGLSVVNETLQRKLNAREQAEQEAQAAKAEEEGWGAAGAAGPAAAGTGSAATHPVDTSKIKRRQVAPEEILMTQRFGAGQDSQANLANLAALGGAAGAGAAVGAAAVAAKGNQVAPMGIYNNSDQRPSAPVLDESYDENKGRVPGGGTEWASSTTGTNETAWAASDFDGGVGSPAPPSYDELESFPEFVDEDEAGGGGAGQRDDLGSAHSVC